MSCKHNHEANGGNHVNGFHSTHKQNEPASEKLSFVLNGKKQNVKDASANMTLLEFLREKKGLTGTKLGCGEGGCGACSVVVNGKTVNSCLTPLPSVDGLDVTTVEGLGDIKSPHIVQKTIAESHGSQCGFCTPGFVMSLYNKFEEKHAENPDIESCTDVDIESCFDGNLCRCTGYRPLIDAAKQVLQYEEKEGENGKLNGNHSCKNGNGKAATKNKRISSEDTQVFLPTTIDELLEAMRENPDAKIVAGNTELGVEHRFKHSRYKTHIYVRNIEELKTVSIGHDGALHIGGAATLSTIKSFIEKSSSSLKEEQTRGFKAMAAMLKWFASTQIRNMATLSGNIATASPISDMNPVLMALDAHVVLRSAMNKTRQVKLRKFFKSYRKVDMSEDEIIESIVVPPTEKYEYVECYKQARRREDDISIVNACFKAKIQPSEDKSEWKISDISLVFGGVAPTTIAATKTENVLRNLTFSKSSIDTAISELAKELALPDGVPGGMAKFRTTLVLSFLHKYYLKVACDLKSVVSASSDLPTAPEVDKRELSGAETYMNEEELEIKSTQVYTPQEGGLQLSNVAGKGVDHAPSKELIRSPVGDPVMHRSALGQCTGEAQYIDDIPTPSGSLHAAFLLSTRPHAKIISIDASEAEELDGFVEFISAKDMTAAENAHGPVVMDEELFRINTVTSTGQPLGLCVAESHNIAKEAARKIKVVYEDMPAIISIADAREAKSFHQPMHEIQDGNPAKALEDADIVVSGEIRMAGQEHFYLETNASLAVPGEDGELTVYASTQNPDKTQTFTASCCSLPRHKVVCRVKRMGGAFGGKETRSVFISAAAGVAANKLKKAVKIVLDRDEDMWITGTRHPYVGVYKAGAMKDGTLVAIDVDLYSNAGYSSDLSASVMDRALFHVENSYKIPNVRVKGHLCNTNTTTNTAFRGFGGPQGMFVCESIIEHLASEMKMEPEQIRAKNLYHIGEKTHYGQVVEDSPLRRLWDEVYAETKYEARKEEIAAFNAENRWKKRGISVMTTKFGISFTNKMLNQAGALVHVYRDGTVLVTHGGTEMGQGLHTKVIQVAAREFGIPVEMVHISETATDKVPNTSPTAASASSDMYGMAVLNACEQINERMAPVRKANPGLSFKDLVNKAYFQRVDLSAHGFYATPYTGYTFNSDGPTGDPFNYYTYGAACTEVEVDVLTGDSRMLRADIVMDLGQSLNPAIDVGQIEGGFLQGFGWCTIEEPVWGCKELSWIKEGDCFTRGPGTYKIPSSNDIPGEFNIRLLDNSPCKKAIHSSRAVGEPPFFLGATAYFAIRKAIAAARVDASGDDSFFVTDSPLSSERIRMACFDDLTAKTCSKDYKPNLWC